MRSHTHTPTHTHVMLSTVIYDGIILPYPLQNLSCSGACQMRDSFYQSPTCLVLVRSGGSVVNKLARLIENLKLFYFIKHGSFLRKAGFKASITPESDIHQLHNLFPNDFLFARHFWLG